MSGAPYSPLNAPRRAQRRAVRGGSAAAPQQAQAPVPAPSPPAPSVADAWNQIVQIRGITPLASDYAARAQQGQ